MNMSESKQSRYSLIQLVGHAVLTFMLSYLRYFAVVGFVLVYLRSFLLWNDIVSWCIFALSTFGLWKLFDHLEHFVRKQIDSVD